jgi:aldehyde dehydrogenase (NAD+)
MSEDVDRAVSAARSALHSKEWQGTNPYERGYLMLAWAQKIKEHKDALARLLSIESGKTLRDCYGDVHTAVRNLEYFSGWADKIYGRVAPTPAQGVFDYMLREPLGVVGHIVPWNYPLDIFMRGVAPCIAAGNTVVVKPAEETPLSTIVLTRLSREAGFPPGVINVVTGYGKEAGAALAGHPGLHGLAFCGSIITGKEVLHTAAERITPVISLELGGKAACIIFPDGNLQKAVVSKARGLAHNTGQSCGSRSRILVPAKMYDQAVKLMQITLEKIQLGYGLDDPDMGPLASAKQLERVSGYIRSGVEEGADLICGGKHPETEPLKHGFYIKPALFGRAKAGMKIVEEEIFGPVTALLTYESEEEAVAMANNTMYGLGAELWTENLALAHRAAAQLDVSHVTINGSGGFGVDLPFGGVKQSGFGREGGLDSILQYTRIKQVWVQLD